MLTVLAFPAFKNRASNPYNHLLYSAARSDEIKIHEFSFKRLFLERHDIVHVHWPEFYLNSGHYLKALLFSAMLLVGLALARMRSSKVVWTVHNLHPHAIRYPKLNGAFWPPFLKLIDGTLSFSVSNQEQLFETYPALARLPHAVAHHGTYAGVYPDTVDRETARAALDIPPDAEVVLFIGQVKPYKNVEALVAAFKDYLASRNPAALLIVAGRIDQKYGPIIRDLSAGDPRIRIVDAFIKDEDLQTYFRASTLCVLPYKKIFNSGSLLLAATFDCRTLVPRSRNFEEYAGLLPDDLLTLYDGSLDARALHDALKSARTIERSPEIPKLDWRRIAADTTAFYRSLKT